MTQALVGKLVKVESIVPQVYDGPLAQTCMAAEESHHRHYIGRIGEVVSVDSAAGEVPVLVDFKTERRRYGRFRLEELRIGKL